MGRTTRDRAGARDDATLPPHRLSRRGALVRVLERLRGYPGRRAAGGRGGGGWRAAGGTRDGVLAGPGGRNVRGAPDLGSHGPYSLGLHPREPGGAFGTDAPARLPGELLRRALGLPLR